MPTAQIRDHRLDIAKGVLICLVVVGHLLEGMNYWKVPESRIPLTIIYAFHMPAFAFLAGITARPTQLLRRVGPLLILLLLFQLAYYWAVQLLGLKRTFSLDTPFWILWFLFALACWTLLTPIMARFPKSSTAAVVVAALVAITASWVGYPYSAARMLAFLPFFTVGFLYGKRIMAWTAAASWTVRAGLAGSSLAVVALLLNARLGVLARQYAAARSDLAGATTALNKYFDPASRRTQSAATVLQQAQAHMKEFELPRLDETLSALATAAAGR